MHSISQASRSRAPLTAADPVENDLVARAIEGDRCAFEEIYRRYAWQISEACRRYLQDQRRIEDVTQETFVRALSNIGAFRQGQRLWPWLWTIARNACIDELRAQRRGATTRSPLERDGENDGPSLLEEEPDHYQDVTAEEVVRRLERMRAREILTSVLPKLASRQRRILWLHDVEERTWEEVAAADASTVHAVRNIAWRARKTLRLMLADTSLGVRVVLGAVFGGVFRRAKQRLAQLGARPNLVGDTEAVREHLVAFVFGIGAIAATVGASTGAFQGLDGLDRPIVRQVAVVETNDVRKGALPLASTAIPAPVSLDAGEAQAKTVPLRARTAYRQRDGAAAPSEGRLTVEVEDPTDPSGPTWYEHKSHYNCMSDEGLLVSGGPVNAYC